MVMMMMVMMVLPTLTLLISILAMHRSASIESKWEARESITLLSATPTWPKSCEYLSGLWLFFFFKIDDDDDEDEDDGTCCHLQHLQLFGHSPNPFLQTNLCQMTLILLLLLLSLLGVINAKWLQWQRKSFLVKRWLGPPVLASPPKTLNHVFATVPPHFWRDHSQCYDRSKIVLKKQHHQSSRTYITMTKCCCPLWTTWYFQGCWCAPPSSSPSRPRTPWSSPGWRPVWWSSWPWSSWTCGVTLVVVVISPTKVQLQAVRALMVNFGAKHHYKDKDVWIKHHLLAKKLNPSLDAPLHF